MATLAAWGALASCHGAPIIVDPNSPDGSAGQAGSPSPDAHATGGAAGLAGESGAADGSAHDAGGDSGGGGQAGFGGSAGDAGSGGSAGSGGNAGSGGSAGSAGDAGVADADVDECALGTHDCDAAYGTCVDTPSGFDCGCAGGTVAQPDGSCLPSDCTVARILGATVSGTTPIDRGQGTELATCDQQADGGGWTLVLNYVHRGGTQPAVAAESVLPVMSSDTLGDDESSVDSAWGHLDNATLITLLPRELRFAARTSFYDPVRPVDFATANVACINYLGSGMGDCAGVATDASTRALSGQSPDSRLPLQAATGAANQGDLAMTNATFVKSGTEAEGGTFWNIGVYASPTFPARTWDAGNGYTQSGKTYFFNTIHRVYVRSAFPTDCADVVASDYFRGPALYTVDPDLTESTSPHTVECDASGATVSSPYATCSDVAAENPDARLGTYFIDPDGPGGVAAALTTCTF